MADEKPKTNWPELPELRDAPCLGRELREIVAGLSDLTHRRLNCEIRPRFNKQGILEYAGVVTVRNTQIEREIFSVVAGSTRAVGEVKKVLASEETQAILVSLLEVARMA